MRLAVFNIPASGHVNPTLPVVAELVRRGVQVTYYCTEAYRSKIDATGAAYRAYVGADDTLAPDEDGPTAPFSAMRQLLATGAGLLPGLVNDMRTFGPDAVVYDTMTPWGKQVGQILKLPVIASCAIFMIHSRNFSALKKDYGVGLQMALALPRAVPLLRASSQIAAAIQTRFGVPSPAWLDFFANPGDMTLVYSSRAFTAGAERFDDSFKFVGVSIAPRNDAGDFPLYALDGKPVVYISLGTLFNKQTRFFRDCITAFRDGPNTVVMSIGQTVHVSDLGDIPPNVIVRQSVPQLEVLARASVFITHGGMNSAAESMWFGVPMVVVPQAGDQSFVGQRLAQLGAGVVLRASAVTPESLRTAVARVMHNAAYRDNARRLGDSLRSAGGFVRAADDVQRFVGRHAGYSAS